MTDNLTRDEARERARLLSDVSYEVALDLTATGRTFPSRTVVRFRCAETGAGTFLDLTADAVHRVELNGRPLPADAVSPHRIRLDDLAADNELVVEADCVYRRTGTGLHRFTDPADGAVYVYTQFEPFDAHAVFGCFDQPDLKATYAFTVEAPAGWEVASNTGPRERPEPGAPGRWAFEPTATMSTYLAAICGGPFHIVRDHHGPVDLGLWCRTSLAEHLEPQELFDLTKRGFDFFEDAFGVPYPFGKYDQVFCPEYKFGAMENAGCVTFSERYVFRSKVTEAERERRAETLLHELSHMWFGDLVTMRWWDDLWLNESFATYMAIDALVGATRFTDAWTGFATRIKGWAYRQDQLPTTHPITADIGDVEATHLHFDGITYAKGASVLRGLVAWVGKEAFTRGVRRYFERHAWGNTELADFLGPLEEASGRDLGAWSKAWLETSGVNTLRPDVEADDRVYTRFDVLQEAPSDHPILRPHRLGIGLYDASDDGLVLRRRVETDVTGERTPVDELVGEPPADLVFPNDDDLAYAKVRFDPASYETLVGRLAELPDPLARAVAWGAAWDMVRDAELPASDYLRLVEGNATRERNLTIVSRLGRTADLLARYADPGKRERALERLAAVSREAMRDAEPGGDLQLAWTRAYVDAATSPGQLDELRGLLDGSIEVDGLAVDTDLRWQIVRALAASGAADEDVIAAELERDPTDQGERHAAAARAARPTAEAKAEAWERATASDLPLATLRAIASGFGQPTQPELLEPYREPYFSELGRFWADRGVDLALGFAGGFYPHALIDPETAERTERYLSEEDPPVPIRRILLEGADDVRRALRARARDASTG